MPSAAPSLSIWDLFQNADFVVKFVMIGLLIASVAVWAIAVTRSWLYARTRRAMDGFEQAFWWASPWMSFTARWLHGRPNRWRPFCRGDAGMEAQRRNSILRRSANAHRR